MSRSIGDRCLNLLRQCLAWWQDNNWHAPLESKIRIDRGWLSFKTCFSELEVQDVLAEMCNGSMLTGLYWISDGETVITTDLVCRLTCTKCSNTLTTSSHSVLSDYDISAWSREITIIYIRTSREYYELSWVLYFFVMSWVEYFSHHSTQLNSC